MSLTSARSRRRLVPSSLVAFLSLAVLGEVGAKTFVLPHVFETRRGGNYTFDTTIFAVDSAGLLGGALPGGAVISARLYDTDGVPLISSGGTAVCDPCTVALDGSRRKGAVTVEDLCDAAGGVEDLSRLGFVVLEVPDGSDEVAFLEAVVSSGESPGIEDVHLSVPREQGTGGSTRKTYVIPHVLESSGKISDRVAAIDTTLHAVYSSGLGPLVGTIPPGAKLELSLYDSASGKPLVSSTGTPVCAPCTASLDIVHRDLALRLDGLIEAAGGFPASQVSAFATVVVDGDADGVTLDCISETAPEGDQGTPLDLSVFGFQPQEVQATSTKRTLVVPHVLDSPGRIGTPFTFDTTIFAVYTGGLDGTAGSGASVSLYLLDETGAGPLVTAGGEAVCNPCTETLGAGERKKSLNVEALIAARGEFPATRVEGSAVIVVEGDASNVALQSFIVNSHTGAFDLSVLSSAPAEVGSGDGPPSTRRTHVAPHVFEQKGRASSTQHTADTRVIAVYAGTGADGVPPPGARVKTYLYDGATGEPLRSATGADVCNPCVETLGAGHRKMNRRAEEEIIAAGGFPEDPVDAFAVIEVEGDADAVALQAFIVNSHTNPFDLSFAGYAPVLTARSAGVPFVTGDVNGDGAYDISDGIALLGYLFLGTVQVPCLRGAEVNGDEAIDISDATFILSNLFLGGRNPRPPFPACGQDPSGSALPCDAFPACSG